MKRLAVIVLIISVTLGVASSVKAADGLNLNAFVPNTPAKAESVNENFIELEESIPVMWASIDQDPAAVAFTVATTSAVINSLSSIIVPDPGGILLINGSAFVNNDSANKAFALNLLIDGLQPDMHTFQAAFFAADEPFFNAEGFTLAYTYAVPVAAGTFTVSQVLDTLFFGPATFTYNKNNLTVIFFPALPGGAPIQVPVLPVGAELFSPADCETGNPCP